MTIQHVTCDKRVQKGCKFAQTTDMSCKLWDSRTNSDIRSQCMGTYSGQNIRSETTEHCTKNDGPKNM